VADDAGVALSGKLIFVSRGRAEAQKLCDGLESRGARVLALPLLRFALPEDVAPLDASLKNLREFDWWLLTSQHAAEFGAARCSVLGLSLAELAKGVRVGAVGPATAKAAMDLGLAVEYTARQQSGAGLAQELAERVAGKRVLLLRSNLADSTLPSSLAESGAEVTDVMAYRTLPPSEDENRLLKSIAWETVDAVVFFSSSAVRHLAEAVGLEKMRTITGHAVCLAMGPTTAGAARRQGFERCVTAEPSPSAVTDALEESLADRRSRGMTGVNRA
jgi:uroporphyrinogen-III synthase